MLVGNENLISVHGKIPCLDQRSGINNDIVDK